MHLCSMQHIFMRVLTRVLCLRLAERVPLCCARDVSVADTAGLKNLAQHKSTLPECDVADNKND